MSLERLDLHLAGQVVMLELKNNPSFRQKVEDALSSRFQQFATEATAAMSEAVVRLRNARDVHAERVVVIADGLEKFTPLREEDRDVMEASVESLFVQHARLLRLPCHVIYTFPLWLRFRVAELGSLYDSQPLVLPMVKIAERTGGRTRRGSRSCGSSSEGESTSRASSARTSGLLTDLVLASGGYPRDLLRMMREVLVRGESFPVAPKVVSRVIDDLAREYAVIVRGTHVPMLRALAGTHRMPQGDSGEVAAFGRLLEKWLVLAYRDDDEWYDLHPLVKRAPLVAGALADALKLAPEIVAAFESLARSLALMDGFALIPLEVTGPDLGRAFAAWLLERGRQTRVVEPLDEPGWRAIVASLLDDADERTTTMVLGPRTLAPGMAAGLSLLNQRRDSIVSGLAHPLLWCGPLEFLKATWERAPDTLVDPRDDPQGAPGVAGSGGESAVAGSRGAGREGETARDARGSAGAGDALMIARVSVQLAEALLAAGEFAEANEVVARAREEATDSGSLALLEARAALRSEMERGLIGRSSMRPSAR